MLLIDLKPVPPRLASLRPLAEAARGRLAVAAAIVCTMAYWCITETTARGQSTLLQFINENETFDGQPATTLLGSLSTEGLAVERLHPPTDEQATGHMQPMGEPPIDFACGPYGSGVQDDPSLMSSDMPINWISGPYFRYGVDFIIGDGVLEGGQKVSWGINGGYRQPFSLGLAPPNMFFDLGGGYSSAVGMTERLVDATETTFAGTTIERPDSMRARLTEVKRASIQAALGWYWGDPVDHREFDPQLRFATRFGGRVGSVRGNFLESRVSGNNVPDSSTLTTDYLNTDTFGGLLLGAEAILLKRSYGNCNVLWTADLEFSNDWIEFGGYSSGSLGLASLMTGLMLSR